MSAQHPARRASVRGVEYALARQRAKYEVEVSRLLDATLAVMREQETADPTVSEILRRAGLSTAAFYRHFPTKDDLLVALLDQAHDMMASHLSRRLEAAQDPLGRIEAWVRAMFDLVRTAESVATNRPLLMAHPRLLQQFPDEISAGFGALALPLQVAIAAARAAGGLPVDDASLDSRLALHQVFGILVDSAAVGRPPSSAVIDGVVRYTLHATLAAERTQLRGSG